MTNYLLVSGGLDSYALKVHLEQNLFPENDLNLVHFLYGAPYSDKEYRKVEELYPQLNKIYISIGSEWAKNLTTEKYILPARNLVFLSIVAGLKPDSQCSIYVAGVQDENHRFMLDKNSAIFEEFENLLTRVVGKPVYIISPFFDKRWSKIDVVENIFLKNGRLDFMNTTSCYHPTSLKCGECFVCAKRWILEAKIRLLIERKYPELEKLFLTLQRESGFDVPIIPSKNKHIVNLIKNYSIALLQEKFDHYAKNRIVSDLQTLEIVWDWEF